MVSLQLNSAALVFAQCWPRAWFRQLSNFAKYNKPREGSGSGGACEGEITVLIDHDVQNQGVRRGNKGHLKDGGHCHGEVLGFEP